MSRHSQAGNRGQEKQPEPGIYGGKNSEHPKIPQSHLHMINRNTHTHTLLSAQTHSPAADPFS